MSMNTALVFPMAALVLVTFLVSLVTFRVRIKAVRTGEIKLSYFKTFREQGTIPEDVLKTQRHLTNLFELPVLFYAACLAGLVITVHAPLLVLFAWIFVGARVVHAWIHIGSNSIRPRMASFVVGWLALIAMWVNLVIVASV